MAESLHGFSTDTYVIVLMFRHVNLVKQSSHMKSSTIQSSSELKCVMLIFKRIKIQNLLKFVKFLKQI